MTAKRPEDIRSIMKRVARHTGYRVDVVEEILNGFIDIAVEEIVNKGKFYFAGLFSVSSYKVSGYKNQLQDIKAHERLRSRIGPSVRNLWKYRHNEHNGAEGVVTKDNWRQYAQMIRDENSSRLAAGKDSIDSSSNNFVMDDNNFKDSDNPFLDDED